MGRDEDEPQPKKRTEKDGDRDGGMMRLALRFTRHLGKTAHAAPVMKAGRKGFKAAQAAIMRSAASDDYGMPGPGSDVHCFCDPHWTGTAFEAVDEITIEPQEYFSPQLQ